MSASVAVTLFAAAITPGPNLVVMDVARHGFYATVAPVAGIVLGTLVLIFVVRFGLDVALSEHPKAGSIMRIAGACMPGYLAIRTLVGGWSGAAERTDNTLAQGTLFFAIFTFQVVNPKTWVLAGAVSVTDASQKRNVNSTACFARPNRAVRMPHGLGKHWPNVWSFLSTAEGAQTYFDSVFAGFCCFRGGPSAGRMTSRRRTSLRVKPMNNRRS